MLGREGEREEVGSPADPSHPEQAACEPAVRCVSAGSSAHFCEEAIRPLRMGSRRSL